MARTIYFTDGSREVLFCDPDDTESNITALEQILKERLGNDTAELFNDIVADMKAQIEEAECNYKEDKDYV